MTVCPECKGDKTITLLYSREPCTACGGTGEVRGPEKEEKAETPSSSITCASNSTTSSTSTFSISPNWTRSTGISPNWTLSTGTASTSLTASPGGDITITGGSGSSSDNLITITSGSGASSDNFITITGGSGSPENMKFTSSHPVNFGSLPKNKKNASAEQGALAWAEKMLSEKPAHGDLPPWVVGSVIPATAPVKTAILADMTMMLEDVGEEPEAFVFSCRDFADVLKFGDAPMLEWKGRSAKYFGTPILRSRHIPAGYCGLVSKGRKMALCTVTR